MVLANIEFNETKLISTNNKNKYLNDLKENALFIWNLIYYGNNLNLQNLKTKLFLMEDYVSSIFKIKFSIYDLIRYVLRNIKLDLSQTHIIFDSMLLIDGIPIQNILKLIRFGNSEIRGNDIIKYCLDTGWKKSLVKILMLGC